MKKIAILGANGYIGKSLAFEFVNRKGGEKIYLFVREKEKISEFVKQIMGTSDISVHVYDEFVSFQYDAIINCIGIGNPSVLKENQSEIFRVTETIDNMITEYLKNNPNVFYINLSSGAAYGNHLKSFVSKDTETIIKLNDLTSSDYYSIAKINSEAKHRSLHQFNIVDIRVFAFFSRFFNLDSKFLISEIIQCVKDKKVFETSDDNIIRDYIGQEDLYNLINKIIEGGKVNNFYDVYSLGPVSKFELLDFFKEKYGLEYRIVEKNSADQSPTGYKKEYFSKNHKAEETGYKPQFSTLSWIESELKNLEI